jgi:hypothetical protein
MSILSSWLSPPVPDAAVEIAPGRVSVVVLRGRPGGGTLEAHASERLPEGAVVPSLTARNIVEPEVVTTALRRAIEGLGGRRPGRVALVVPDGMAKVSLVRFERVPPQQEDLDQLVRWQLRKAAPFAVEDAVVSYAPGIRNEAGVEFVTVMARRDIVGEYEGVCDSLGLHAGLLDLATFSVLNLCLATGGAASGDWLFVHLRPECASLAILRGEHVIFFRSRPDEPGASLGDLVHQTTMYYQDRLSGGGFTRVVLAGSGGADDSLDVVRRDLQERLRVPVEALSLAGAVTARESLPPGSALADALGPALGILLRSQTELVTA